MGNYQQYQIGQSTQITINEPRPLIAIGGDNPTPFYLFFPTMPFGLQWVFPFVYGFLYPFPVPRFDAVLIDSSKAPAGAQLPTAGSTALATFNAYQYTPNEPIPSYSPGTPSIASTILRWNISSQPGSGVQATATRAASPSVTHIGDSLVATLVAQATPTPASVQAALIDGVSGGTTYLWRGVLGSTNTQGSAAAVSQGPGLTLRGTAGNAMTFEFNAGVANVSECVSLSGYDQ